MIKTEIDDKKCKILLNGIEKQGKNMTLAMRIIAKDLQSSIERNFEVGGRYSSKDSIVGGSKKWDISKYGGGSLISRGVGGGNLSGSFTKSSDNNSATVGTNKKYARILNFGGKTKPHEIWYRNASALKFLRGGQPVFYGKVKHPGSNIPARPFMVVQPEDIEGFKETILEHLTGDAKP